MIGGRSRVLEETEKELYVCKNCLQYLHYGGYDHTDYSKGKRNFGIYAKFNLDEYFKKYKRTFIVDESGYSAPTAPVNIYPDRFSDIAKRAKQINKWTCENCGLNLKENKKFLHVHHKDANKANNSLSNLGTLCIKCHSEMAGHSFVKRSPDYKEFISLGLDDSDFRNRD